VLISDAATDGSVAILVRVDGSESSIRAGTKPIPASSGRIVRHRLNRGGDRALNCAIHTIALTRIRSCHRTRAYIDRRTAEGKTAREDRRCLKAIHRPRAQPAPHPIHDTGKSTLTNREASEGRSCDPVHRPDHDAARPPVFDQAGAAAVLAWHRHRVAPDLFGIPGALLRDSRSSFRTTIM
jgi:hypothetical protein